MTLVLSAPRSMTTSSPTALFVLADLTPQMTMKTMIGIEDDLYANHGGRVARPAADCTQTCRFTPISVAEVTGICRATRLLEACGESTQVHGVGMFGRDSRASAKDKRLDPLTEPKQVIVAVCRAEGDVGFQAVICITSQNSIWSSVLNA